MSSLATYSQPFLHYQVHQVDIGNIMYGSADKEMLEGSSFFPSEDGGSIIFPTDDVNSIQAVVYNLYFYTEGGMLVETFAHKFKKPVSIKEHHMWTGLTTRMLADIFPNSKLSASARRIVVTQFIDR